MDLKFEEIGNFRFGRSLVDSHTEHVERQAKAEGERLSVASEEQPNEPLTVGLPAVAAPSGSSGPTLHDLVAACPHRETIGCRCGGRARCALGKGEAGLVTLAKCLICKREELSSVS